MPRSIDHLVIPARNLGAQADVYRRLGFQVGARNRHPWGTENHIVQFDGAFLELIGLGAGFTRPPALPGVFSFADFVAQSLERREGLAMLVLASDDAEADRRAFAKRGLGRFERFDFARKAQKPDGQEADVAFSLAFAASHALPETGFFVCQQLFPKNFWNPAAQIHVNGARGIAGLAFAHERPAEAVDFLSTFLDAPALPHPGGGAFDVNRARVTVAPAKTLAERYGVDAARLQSPSLVAADIAVDELAATAAHMRANGIAFQRRDELLVIDADASMGAILAFTAAP